MKTNRVPDCASSGPEYRRRMVELVRTGRSPGDLAKEFEPTRGVNREPSAVQVLAGMSVKNAVLIVEFAKQQQEHHRGMKAAEDAIEAVRLRLRPILMTSFAFIFGVIPPIIATGAGAEMRQALGTVVFFGMIGVTFLACSSPLSSTP